MDKSEIAAIFEEIASLLELKGENPFRASPQRLDMDWRYWRGAKDKGLLCCINTDAHSIAHHAFIRCGINVARKGWLEKSDIINTGPLKDLLKYFLLF